MLIVKQTFIQSKVRMLATNQSQKRKQLSRFNFY